MRRRVRKVWTRSLRVRSARHSGAAITKSSFSSSMATVSTYLHFSGNAEEAFQFYRSVFGTEFSSPISRFKDIPPEACPEPIPLADQNLVMNVALPILGGHLLMGNDAPGWLGQLVKGNNVDISLHPDTRAEADRLFAGLSEGGKIEMQIQDMFWGDYFGSCVDKFGINWMINCRERK